MADGPAPERADAARNRQAILAAALDLVRTRGVDSVTMDTVSQVQGHLLAHQYEGLVKKAKLRGKTR